MSTYVRILSAFAVLFFASPSFAISEEEAAKADLPKQIVVKVLLDTQGTAQSAQAILLDREVSVTDDATAAEAARAANLSKQVIAIKLDQLEKQELPADMKEMFGLVCPKEQNQRIRWGVYTPWFSEGSGGFYGYGYRPYYGYHYSRPYYAPHYGFYHYGHYYPYYHRPYYSHPYTYGSYSYYYYYPWY